MIVPDYYDEENTENDDVSNSGADSSGRCSPYDPPTDWMSAEEPQLGAPETAERPPGGPDAPTITVDAPKKPSRPPPPARPPPPRRPPPPQINKSQQQSPSHKATTQTGASGM